MYKIIIIVIVHTHTLCQNQQFTSWSHAKVSLYRTSTYVTPLLVLSVCLVDSIISSGTRRSKISLMNLFRANPTLMVSTALGLWVELSLKYICTFITLAPAMASTASFQLSSLKPSWIRREHVRNKPHYHTQDSFTSVACPQYYQWSTCKCVWVGGWVWHHSQYIARHMCTCTKMMKRMKRMT